MAIYKLTNKPNGFASINFGDLDMSKILATGDIKQLNGREFHWTKDADNSKISDCPFFIGALPIFKASKVASVIDKLNVNKALFSVDGESYTAIAAPLFKGKAINREKSTMRAFKSGKIMTVEKYVFNKGIAFPSAFRLEEFNLFTFVDQESYLLLKSCNLSEFVAEPCQLA